MTFRLSPELRGRLITAAGERPFGEEIRRRLERSFEASYEPVLWDRQSLALHEGIVAAIQTLGHEHAVQLVNALTSTRLDELGPWHSDPNAFAALQRAIELLLSAYRPEGEPNEVASDALATLALGGGLRALAERDPKRAKDVLGVDEEDHDDKTRP
jgi:hypothetical protein